MPPHVRVTLGALVRAILNGEVITTVKTKTKGVRRCLARLEHLENLEPYQLPFNHASITIGRVCFTTPVVWKACQHKLIHQIQTYEIYIIRPSARIRKR